VSAGCPVKGCGQGGCLVDACNPGNGVDVSEIVWHDDFGLCAEIAAEAAEAKAARATCSCGTTVADFPALVAHWDECSGGPS
jgi:hypothetical protein